MTAIKPPYRATSTYIPRQGGGMAEASPAGTERMTLLTVDLHVDPLTVADAAELAGVSAEVIRQWIHRRHITPIKRTPAGRPLLLGIDVLRAKARLHPPHARKLRSPH